MPKYISWLQFIRFIIPVDEFWMKNFWNNVCGELVERSSLIIEEIKARSYLVGINSWTYIYRERKIRMTEFETCVFCILYFSFVYFETVHRLIGV